MKSLLPIILIIAAIGLFFVQVNPLYSEVKQLRAEEKKYNEAIEISKELEQLRTELSNKLASFSPVDLDRLEKFLPGRLDTVRIILDLDTLAQQYGIELKDITVSDSSQSGANSAANRALNSVVTISFGFQSPYSQGKAFIQEVEKSLRIFDGTDMSIKPSTEDDNVFDFKTTFKTYWINR